MTAPLFTLVTVVRENDAGLKTTARSIALQLHHEAHEWLVIDTTSGEKTAAILQEHAPPQTVHHPAPNMHWVEAMNYGLRIAQGRYIWFLNPGDCLSDAFILRDMAKQVQYTLAADFIYGDIREQGRPRKPRDASRFLWGPITALPGMVFRRQKADGLSFEESDYDTDAYAFTLKFLATDPKVASYARIFADLGTAPLDLRKKRREQMEIRAAMLGVSPLKNRVIYWINLVQDFFG